MGNCIKKESSMRWGGEDWSSATSETVLFPKTTAKISPHHPHHESSCDYGYGKAMNGEKEEEEGLIAKKKKLKCCPFGSNTTAATEVKIKITKKQLEELISRADLEGLSIQQVLAQMMNAADKFDTHQRSWRPALQSIPEADVN